MPSLLFTETCILRCKSNTRSSIRQRFEDVTSCLPAIIKELIYIGDEDVGDFDGEYRLVSTKEYYEEWD